MNKVDSFFKSRVMKLLLIRGSSIPEQIMIRGFILFLIFKSIVSDQNIKCEKSVAKNRICKAFVLKKNTKRGDRVTRDCVNRRHVK
jgi:hypothetical protein